MMLPRFLTTKVASNLFDSYSVKLCLKQRYSTNDVASPLNKCYTPELDHLIPLICSNRNLTTISLKTASGSNILCLPKNTNTLTLPKNLVSRLQFSSSAIVNVDHSDSSKRPSIFQRLYRKVMPEGLSVSKTSLYKSGAILSACCTHEVDLDSFFKAFDLPDTYYSWWLVTELHAWMICVRLAVGNTKEGLHCRNCMVTELYNDMDERAKKVADMDRKTRANVVWDLAEEFKFAMLIYDLGLAGSDVDLANSIWRRFYLAKDDPDVEKIELLVKYIRKTVASLDHIKIDDLFSIEAGYALNWPDIKKLEKEKN